MVEIEFSVMVNAPEEVEGLLPLLKTFERQEGIRVRLRYIVWANGWADIFKFGLYGTGPDISEVGSTWVGSLAGMNVLRPFTTPDIAELGGASSFFHGLWRSSFVLNEATPWAVPWMSDTYGLYYRRDFLEEAGLDPENAFASYANLVKTLEALQASGHDHPLALTTSGHLMCLHEAATFLWKTGGSFISADGREVMFNAPAALAGLKAYFGLGRFVQPEKLTIVGETPTALLRSGQAAVTIAGHWVAGSGRLGLQGFAPLGVAPVPGEPYVGGTHLVIWQYSRHAREALQFLKFLSRRPHTLPDRLLPVREADLTTARQDPVQAVFLQALRTGQAFPTFKLWGLVEDGLVTTLGTIWDELLPTPQPDLDALLHRHLDPLADRLNLVLGG